ncbi:MAG: phytoene desaturase family protein [Desulfomonilia bacterium]
MSRSENRDVLVAGSGPNGLAASITLSRAGRKVILVEEKDIPGGCLISGECTLPGFVHDLGSAVYPFSLTSPFFASLPGGARDIPWLFPEASLVHPFDDGHVAAIYRDMDRTVEGLGEDGIHYRQFIGPFLHRFEDLLEDILQPLHVPRHPEVLLSLGFRSLLPLTWLAPFMFRSFRGRALIAGLGAHSILPLEHPLSSSFSLIMAASCHSPGWPVPQGGSGRIADHLVNILKNLGGEIVTSAPVRSLDDLTDAGEVFLDLTPRQVLRVLGRTLPSRYRDRLMHYRYGHGIFKVDWALEGPIPWKARECSQTCTLHLGGTMEEIALAEREVWQGRHPEHPFVILVQPSILDSTRAPRGCHTAWAYCHVPNGSIKDMTERIERQVERFAPGFLGMIMAKRSMNTRDLELFNANLVGGDIAGGVQDFRQLFSRPIPTLHPYALPIPGMYLCSSSTPPGAGVHGMCGYNAARFSLGSWNT